MKVAWEPHVTFRKVVLIC